MKASKMSPSVGMFLLMLLTGILVACSTSQGTNTGGNPSPTETPKLYNPTSPIKAIRMLDHSTGWALTDQNILLTADGGQVWKDVTPSGSAYGKYAYGDFMSDKYAWVVSTVQPIDNGVNVLRTSDGGEHWQSSTISVSEVALLDPPHFLTTQEGFLEVNIGGGAAGSEAIEIFHTTDGGQNWTEISDTQHANGLPLGGRKNGISFADVHNGWATGQDASMKPWLYVTHDGGHTWNAQSIPPANTDPTVQLSYSTTPPVFFGNTGFLPTTVGMFSANAAAPTNVMEIYKTTDGGATWTLIKPQHAFGESNAAGLTSNDLYIADVSHAWGTDAIGRVWGTSDGFNNWQLFNSQMAGNPEPNPNTLKALSFVDASYGWGITRAKLLHTTDSGRTWSEIVYHFTA